MDERAYDIVQQLLKLRGDLAHTDVELLAACGGDPDLVGRVRDLLSDTRPSRLTTTLCGTTFQPNPPAFLRVRSVCADKRARKHRFVASQTSTSPPCPVACKRPLNIAAPGGLPMVG